MTAHISARVLVISHETLATLELDSDNSYVAVCLCSLAIVNQISSNHTHII